jgi:hypothetical protein
MLALVGAARLVGADDQVDPVAASSLVISEFT